MQSQTKVIKRTINFEVENFMGYAWPGSAGQQ